VRSNHLSYWPGSGRIERQLRSSRVDRVPPRSLETGLYVAARAPAEAGQSSSRRYAKRRRPDWLLESPSWLVGLT
jgi:hypothetical protein